ncbi:hypothetical protein CHELA1G11_13484 [Hyphomicrobiales bacterium]|nr:hypothetical protein CHELA1G2_10835 [Hyphomicrobiales bacterium]CAH1671993.1 hypothetical protein CHELA1G11_13484 [Hyphomicrobiales bacterium]
MAAPAAMPARPLFWRYENNLSRGREARLFFIWHDLRGMTGGENDEGDHPGGMTALFYLKRWPLPLRSLSYRMQSACQLGNTRGSGYSRVAAQAAASIMPLQWAVDACFFRAAAPDDEEPALSVRARGPNRASGRRVRRDSR